MAAKKKTAKKTSTTKKVAAKKSSPAKKVAAKKPSTTKKAAAKVSTAKKSTAKKSAAKPSAAKKTASKPKVVSSTSGADFQKFTPYVEKKGEEYMNDAQIEHFRAILQDWKRELMEEVDRTVHHMQDEAANFPDPNDRATQESEFTMELRTRDRERKLIKKIDESLDKLDGGEYGFCTSCGDEIGIRRLEARPTANLCIECKSLDEIREKTRA